MIRSSRFTVGRERREVRIECGKEKEIERGRERHKHRGEKGERES